MDVIVKGMVDVLEDIVQLLATYQITYSIRISQRKQSDGGSRSLPEALVYNEILCPLKITLQKCVYSSIFSLLHLLLIYFSSSFILT